MKKLFTFALVLLCAWMGGTGSMKAQECFGVPVKEGGGVEMTSLDGKGKPLGILKYKFARVAREGDFTVIDVEMESVSSKGKTEYKSTYSMRCNGNESIVDASSFISGDQSKMFESYNMKFTSDDVVFPSKLSVGQSLKDASLKGTGDAGGLPVTFDMTMTNRKVEAQEKIKVPAGEFEAYKVRADISMKTRTVIPINFEINAVSYRAPGVLWDVKTETYRKGKLIGTTELVKIY